MLRKLSTTPELRPEPFKPGDKVYLKNFGLGQSWLTGEIVKITGPVSYHVRLSDGRIKRCHQD